MIPERLYETLPYLYVISGCTNRTLVTTLDCRFIRCCIDICRGSGLGYTHGQASQPIWY